MSTDEYRPVSVSRRIAAPAAEIFRILTDPRRHTEMDGSGMLRGAVSDRVVSGVGDVFTMRMYFEPLGHYQMNNHVVEYQPDRCIGWEPAAGDGHRGATDGVQRWGHRWSYELAPDGPAATVVTESYDCSSAPADERASMRDGQVWLDAMTETLRRLESLCTTPDRAGA